MSKLIRITTVPISLLVLLKGQMKFMKEQGFEVTMISSSGAEVDALIQQEECPHIAIKLTREITPIADFFSLIKLVKLFRKLKPDIVHTHTPKAGLIGMLAAKIAGVPIRLHTIAGLPWMEYKGPLRQILKLVEKVTAMAACEIFPNSFNQESFLFEQNIARGKMKVLGNGSSNGINSDYFSITEEIKQSSFSLRNDSNVSPEGWVWIFVGRIVRDKGIMELLDAFSKIHQQFPEDRLWLVGEEEPELDPLDEKYRTKLQKDPTIQWWGYQKDIRPFLAAAKVLVFPSYREGFPNVPLQAGSMGCMLLLSDINGCNEIVQSGVDGILVPPKNSELLTAAMLSIRINQKQTEIFAKAIQEKIKNRYNQKFLWKILLQEYNNRLNQIS